MCPFVVFESIHHLKQMTSQYTIDDRNLSRKKANEAENSFDLPRSNIENASKFQTPTNTKTLNTKINFRFKFISNV